MSKTLIKTRGGIRESLDTMHAWREFIHSFGRYMSADELRPCLDRPK